MNALNITNLNVVDFHLDTSYPYDAGIGLSNYTIDYISNTKNESQWVNFFRKTALNIFNNKPIPVNLLNKINFDKISYYLSKNKEPSSNWNKIPSDIKNTFDRLGIPEQERAFLGGIEAQFDSETAYSKLKEEIKKQGIIFVNPHDGLHKYEKIFKKYFSKIVPINDNKFSALNSACFSGGSFIYIPKGLKLKLPLQAYFRINAKNFGQFERTLIIADEESELTYIEGCTAPKYNSTTIHAAVVELVALKGAKIQYITVQNWSNNVLNVVTKRGIAEEDAEIRWIDCNIGSKVTMKYPCIILKGYNSRGEVLSISLANSKQHLDTGAKMIHLSSYTTSNIISKSISIGNGISSYRGKVLIGKNGINSCKNNTECHALLINTNSNTTTYPTISVYGHKNSIQHEAKVSKINEEQIYYMCQRGLNEVQAMSLVVNGFINDLICEFPMEYSIELKKLIELEIETSVG